MKIRVRLRKGDCAWLTLAAGIVAYEMYIEDDADLLSHRAAAYKKRAPELTIAAVLVTAFHLLEWLPPRVDPYHQAVRWVRRRVSDDATISTRQG